MRNYISTITQILILTVGAYRLGDFSNLINPWRICATSVLNNEVLCHVDQCNIVYNIPNGWLVDTGCSSSHIVSHTVARPLLKKDAGPPFWSYDQRYCHVLSYFIWDSSKLHSVYPPKGFQAFFKGSSYAAPAPPLISEGKGRETTSFFIEEMVSVHVH